MWWIIFARYFGLQHKPSTGAIKEKWIQVKDERDDDDDETLLRSLKKPPSLG